MPAPAVPLSRLLEAVADAVAAVRAGRSLTEALGQVPPEARAGTQALSFQVLRHLGAALVLRSLLAPKTPPPPVDALLLTALALLWPDEAQPPPYAEHTLVNQAVAATRQRWPASAGFVNAVLRRYLRERDSLVATARQQPQAVYQHPPWWFDLLRADWPGQWAALLAAANRHPPMALRVNTRRSTVADYLAALQAAGLTGRAVPGLGTPQAVVLDRPCTVQALPGWNAGWVSVQDLSAQRAAPLLLGPAAGLSTLPAGSRVLDACAAPGGKTAHLLELADLDLLALDSDPGRMARVGPQLQRLGLSATLAAAEAGDVAAWWDGRPFDAILLDAPCTASGIVRRHPDVRWLRRPSDVAALARTQAVLLDALWPLLRPGGRLVYATCSVFQAEGQRQIDAFLQRHAHQAPRLAPVSPGHLLGLPDNAATLADAATGDGFFYAVLCAAP
jgi:16S rRNA (cytosine967-C5)-methyltransferase